MRVSPFKVECHTRHGIHEHHSPAKRDFFEPFRRGVHCSANEAPVCSLVHFTDRIVRQSLGVIPDEIRVFLFISVGHLFRIAKFSRLSRGLNTNLECILHSLLSLAFFMGLDVHCKWVKLTPADRKGCGSNAYRPEKLASAITKT
jgi:hypothetical protein